MIDATQSLKEIAPAPCWKMNGSGNDFVVVDNRNSIIPEALKSEWARLVCRPRLAVGADGVVFIESLADGVDRNGPAPDFRWRYFNADGSEGGMCGNGAMCAARFAIDRGVAPNPCAFETPSGVVRAELRIVDGKSTVWLNIPDTGPAGLGVKIELNGDYLVLHSVEVGVPHVVLIVDDADAWPPVGQFDETGLAIRNHQLFATQGTNVNVVSPRDDGSLRMRTYERGVEAETLACGTGAVASAVVASVRGLAASPVTVRTSGGRPLHVEFALDGQTARSIRLGGNAMVVAAGTLLPDVFEESFGGERRR